MGVWDKLANQPVHEYIADLKNRIGFWATAAVVSTFLLSANQLIGTMVITGGKNFDLWVNANNNLEQIIAPNTSTDTNTLDAFEFLLLANSEVTKI